MPTYEYACRACGEHLEVVQSFKDAALTECPHCHGELRKVFGSIGIAFKGSGFYKNDSRSSVAKTKSSSEKGSPEAAKAGSESKTGSEGKGGSDSKSGSDSKTGSGTKAGSDSKAPSSSASTASAS